MYWDASCMAEVFLAHPDDFLKVRETLTRIGVSSKTEKKLFQSCHILHKQGRYFIVHFKELFLLDGKSSDFSENDLQRRNRITKLLADWNLITLADESITDNMAAMSQIKILPYREKKEWQLIAKYSIGGKRN
ncbi:endoribonuclease translational repressor of early genes [Synechococcus phage S-N03]|uniref:Translation repressor protein n=1 Tax=Synechococcus phage S-N03 TaxID=2718943 RepID=A0A6G8R5R7_9CAUD|nr:translation repressor [Synechococcus phage S-N03]QIN96749.1 endoribonuclease translational repressor of early genes [Synechococcus phage S-N03]